MSRTRKDVKHGSKVKGSTKKGLTQVMVGAAGTDPKRSPSPSIRVNVTVTSRTLKSLALVSGNAVCSCPTGSSREYLAMSSVLYFGVFLKEALPTCVIVWPLSACLLQSAAALTPPSPSGLCLPADSYRLASLLFLPFQGLQAKSSSLSELAYL